MSGRRTDNRRSPDPLVHPRSRDEALAEVAPLSLAEHRPIVLAATPAVDPATFPRVAGRPVAIA